MDYDDDLSDVDFAEEDEEFPWASRATNDHDEDEDDDSDDDRDDLGDYGDYLFPAVNDHNRNGEDDDDEEDDEDDDDHNDHDDDPAINDIPDEELIGKLVAMPLAFTAYPSHGIEVLCTGTVVRKFLYAEETFSHTYEVFRDSERIHDNPVLRYTVQFQLTLEDGREDEGNNMMTVEKHLSKREVIGYGVDECPTQLLIKHLGQDGRRRDGPVNWEQFLSDLERIPQLARVSLPPHIEGRYTLYFLLIRGDCPTDVIMKVIATLKDYCKTEDQCAVFFSGMIEECFCQPPETPRHIQNVDPTVLLEFIGVDGYSLRGRQSSFPILSDIVTRYEHRFECGRRRNAARARRIRSLRLDYGMILREPIYLFLQLEEEGQEQQIGNNEDEAADENDTVTVRSSTPQADMLIRNSTETCIVLLMHHYTRKHILPDTLVNLCFDQFTGIYELYHTVYFCTNYHTDVFKFSSLIQYVATYMFGARLTQMDDAEQVATFCNFVLKCAQINAKDQIDLIEEKKPLREGLEGLEPFLRPIEGDILDCLYYVVAKVGLVFPNMNGERQIMELWRSTVQQAYPDVLNRAIRRGFSWSPYLSGPVLVGKPLLLECPDPLTGLVPFLSSALCDTIVNYEKRSKRVLSGRWDEIRNIDDVLSTINKSIPRKPQMERLALERTYCLLRANPTMVQKAGESGTQYINSKRIELQSKKTTTKMTTNTTAKPTTGSQTKKQRRR